MKNRKLELAVISLLTAACVVVGIYNAIKNANFWSSTLTSLLSPVIVLVISFLFVQFNNDDNRKKEKLDKILYKIQEIIATDDFRSCDDSVVQKNLIAHRSIANKIQYISNEKSYGIEEEAEKLSTAFENYREFYGDHYMDKEYMNKSVKEIAHYLTLIDDTCDSIHMKLQ